MIASLHPDEPPAFKRPGETRLRWQPPGPRALLFGAVCAAHVALFGALLASRTAMPSSPPVAALQASLLTELPEPEPAVNVEPTLERFTPTLAPAPVLDLELPAEPLSTAITVATTDDAPPPASPTREPSAPDLETPLQVSSVEYLRPPAPRYPPAAKQARREGIVQLLVMVDTDGQAREIRIQSSSGSAMLDTAAVDSVRAARFRPYAVNGTPRQVVVVVPIEFSLRIRSARR